LKNNFNREVLEDMKGKVAVVTGGAQGIGKAIAQWVLKSGGRVVIADVDPEAGQETVEEFRSPGQIEFFQTDVGDETQVRRLAAETLAAFDRIDLLVNNAGIASNKPITELSLEDWNQVLSTNLTGIFLCVKHMVKELRKNNGSIVNIASIHGFKALADTEAYSATKGGIIAMTEALAMSLGPEVRVNSISPGRIEVIDWKKESQRQQPEHSQEDREQQPVERVGRPEDIAGMVLYLASEKGSFITGQNIVIDGGRAKRMCYSN
jgi:NAD(P)-dependent dehydrogenase (short-subunit alcohol dehydrogenase family)